MRESRSQASRLPHVPYPQSRQSLRRLKSEVIRKARVRSAIHAAIGGRDGRRVQCRIVLGQTEQLTRFPQKVAVLRTNAEYVSSTIGRDEIARRRYGVGRIILGRA